jgi:PLP dependent protein
MTVGPTDGDRAGTRQAFEWVRRLTDELGLTTCSMGMSHDLDIAVDCGTTRVRVGTAVFGERAG